MSYEDAHELLDVIASYTPAPDIRPILLDTRRDAVIWTGPHTYSKDQAALAAMAERVKLEKCNHCWRTADFVEVTEYGLIPWCSLLEARAFYSHNYTRIR